VENFCYLNIINNDALEKLFTPAQGSSWASILQVEVSDNEKLCGNLDAFFPLEGNLHVRKIEGNCKRP
jgi:hypothetical protein